MVCRHDQSASFCIFDSTFYFPHSAFYPLPLDAGADSAAGAVFRDTWIVSIFDFKNLCIKIRNTPWRLENISWHLTSKAWHHYDASRAEYQFRLHSSTVCTAAAHSLPRRRFHFSRIHVKSRSRTLHCSLVASGTDQLMAHKVAKL